MFHEEFNTVVLIESILIRVCRSPVSFCNFYSHVVAKWLAIMQLLSMNTSCQLLFKKIGTHCVHVVSLYD